MLEPSSYHHEVFTRVCDGQTHFTGFIIINLNRKRLKGFAIIAPHWSFFQVPQPQKIIKEIQAISIRMCQWNFRYYLWWILLRHMLYCPLLICSNNINLVSIFDYFSIWCFLFLDILTSLIYFNFIHQVISSHECMHPKYFHIFLHYVYLHYCTTNIWIIILDLMGLKIQYYLKNLISSIEACLLDIFHGV